MTANERDAKVIKYLTHILENVANKEEKDFNHLESYLVVDKLLSTLIPVSIDGFRGVVMTAIAGIYLDEDNSFNPLESFYQCNPRSIYERGIYYVLENFGIPSAKSAPLNVAKAVNQLDEAWILGRKTNAQPIARSAVDFLRLLMSKLESKEYNQLVDFFFYRLLQYAHSIQSYEVLELESSHSSKNILADKLVQFVVQYPEAGTVPQLVIGKLLRFVKQSEHHHIYGEGESVFGTNTTSKKPADIWVEDNQKNVTALYEVTVKKIDYKRLDDCIDALKNLDNIKNNEVSFICRMPIDIKELNLSENQNTLLYKGYWFNFIDIASFIYICLSLMESDQIKVFFLEMDDFLQDVNRPMKTKEGWNSIL